MKFGIYRVGKGKDKKRYLNWIKIVNITNPTLLKQIIQIFPFVDKNASYQITKYRGKLNEA
jgi:hypothetical protein